MLVQHAFISKHFIPTRMSIARRVATPHAHTHALNALEASLDWVACSTSQPLSTRDMFRIITVCAPATAAAAAPPPPGRYAPTECDAGGD